MGARFHIIPATLEHAHRLAEDMRPEDVAECEALGLQPLAALTDSMEASTSSYALFAKGELLAMFGVAPSEHAGVFVAWALSSTAVPRHRNAYLRASRGVVALLQQHYPVLCNYVDARYSAAVRWLRALGFTVHAPQRVGPKGMLFHLVERRA